MKAAQLRVNGEEISLSAVWVHSKASHSNAVPCSLLVTGEFVVEVFTGGRGKPKEMTWEAFVQDQLLEFGDFALSCWLQVLRQLDHVEEEKKFWVIIGVDSVKAVEGGLLLEGFAEGFDRTRVPVLKPLR